MKILKISKARAYNIINRWAMQEQKQIDLGMFWCIGDDGLVLAINNVDGMCESNSFHSFAAARHWLRQCGRGIRHD